MTKRLEEFANATGFEEVIFGPGMPATENREIRAKARELKLMVDIRQHLGESYLIFYKKLNYPDLVKLLKMRKRPYGKYELVPPEQLPKHADVEPMIKAAEGGGKKQRKEEDMSDNDASWSETEWKCSWMFWNMIFFFRFLCIVSRKTFSFKRLMPGGLFCPFRLDESIWAASSEFGTYRLCEQRRFRRACASPQSRQNLRYSLIQAVSQEEPSDRKPDPWPLLMAGHAQLKFVMTECSKTQIRLTRPWMSPFEI